MPIINSTTIGNEKINGAQIITAVAQDKISIGDVVYTVEKKATKTQIPAQEWTYNANASGLSVFSPDGSILIVFGLIHGTHIYSVTNNETLTFIDYLRDEYGDECSNYIFGEFSPDGTLFVASTGRIAYIYTVSGTSLQFKRRINDTSNDPTYVHFSPDGTKMIMPHNVSSNSFDIYSVVESDVQYIGTYGDLVATESDVLAGAFSPDGTLFVNGANRSNSLFQVHSTSTWDLIQSVSAPDGDNLQTITNIKFSPDGTILVVSTDKHTYVFTVSEASISYAQPLYANNNEASLFSIKGGIDFSYDGSYFYATFVDEDAGYLYVKTFTKSGTTLTYRKNAISYSLNEREINELYVTCSPVTNVVVISGGIPDQDYMQGYTSSGYSLNSISTYTPKLTSTLHECQFFAGAFSPDGSVLILSDGRECQIYSRNDSNLTFVGTLAETAATVSHGSIVFSPDGTLLFTGSSTGEMHIYEVSGTTFTLFDSLPATDAVFISDDGSKMIGVQNSDSNIVKYYSINGTAITEISGITMNGSPWNKHVYSIAFTTDGNYAIFCGLFGAYVYQVKTNSVDYFTAISDVEYATSVSRFPNTNEFIIGGFLHVLLENGSPIFIDGSSGSIFQSKISPNGKYIEIGLLGAGGIFYPVRNGKKSFNEEFVLTDQYAMHIFAPDCSIVIGSGSCIEDRLVVYTTFDDKILMQRNAYIMPDNTFGNGIATSAKIGFAKTNMNIGDMGKIKAIHDIKLAPVWG